MKKIIILILFLFVGCSNKSLYQEYVNKAQTIKESSENMPFDVSFYFDDYDERQIYQVIIDNIDYELNNVKAIVVHNQKTEDIFPSIGIVDEPINLNNEQKGINLVGFIPNNSNVSFKVFIEANGVEYTMIYNK